MDEQKLLENKTTATGKIADAAPNAGTYPKNPCERDLSLLAQTETVVYVGRSCGENYTHTHKYYGRYLRWFSVIQRRQERNEGIDVASTTPVLQEGATGGWP